ncbi:MAG TPA: glycosyltransferase family 39 protein [Methylomirabilota bacterium]|nr:glycosyltransferase family 39 protein [Methylomirabilota bacterium]
MRLTPARWAAGLGVAALPLFFAALRHPGFADNEGRYAEVARELVARGDWITPHLNGAPFLNKPPLLFWLTALVFGAVGPTESARLVSGVATLATMAVLYDLGRRLSGSLAGAWAVAAYLTAMSTTVEARTLRPDAWLTLTVAVSLWGAVRLGLDLPRLEAARPARRGRAGGFLALWGGAALGVMAKGLLGLVLPALILLPAVLLGGRPAVIRRWRAGAGLVLVAALVLPWHLAAARANPGFAWDYIVNQHLLFFLDRKLPRDSVPDPLWYAWAAFALRLTPWVLLLPAAVLRQLREARRAATAAAWLPLTWLGMVWLLFSLAPSRLEHYFLPAVPAAALLVGPLCADWAGADGRRGGRAALGACLALTALGAAGALLLPGRLAAGALAALAPLARVASLAVAAGAGAGAWLARRGRPARGAAALVATFLVIAALTVRALALADPAISVRPLVAAVGAARLETSEVACEAGEEYQLCAALAYYVGRPVLLLAPPAFVAPDYLRRDAGHLFVPRPTFWARWRAGQARIVLFTDPERGMDRLAEFPAPRFELARGADRLVLTNLPP